MRKHSSIIVLFLVVVASAPLLSILVLQFQIYSWKLTMQEFLKEKELMTIIVPAKEINWQSEKKEVIIKGNYFDVEKISVNKNGDYELTGLFDTREAKLKLELDTAANETSEEQNDAITDFFSLQGITLKTSATCFEPFEMKTEKKNSYSIPFILSILIEVSTPPPKPIEFS